MKNITIIGSGNVGSHLYKAFSVKKRSVYLLSPSDKSFQYDYSDKEIDFLILALPDDIIGSFISKLDINSHTTICHVSGSLDLNVFQPHFQKFGVFYPLQTFSKTRNLTYSSIPLLIEGNSVEVEKELMQLSIGTFGPTKS